MLALYYENVTLVLGAKARDMNSCFEWPSEKHVLLHYMHAAH